MIRNNSTACADPTAVSLTSAVGESSSNKKPSKYVFIAAGTISRTCCVTMPATRTESSAVDGILGLATDHVHANVDVLLIQMFFVCSVEGRSSLNPLSSRADHNVRITNWARCTTN